VPGRNPGQPLQRVAAAALESDDGSAADTVREIHKAVLAASSETLVDDATVACLAVE